jgi:hypothetical protein
MAINIAHDEVILIFSLISIGTRPWQIHLKPERLIILDTFSNFTQYTNYVTVLGKVGASEAIGSRVLF